MKKMYQDTVDLFNKLDIDPRIIVGKLSASVCQLMEIARAVSYGAKVIIMDEPTSSLTKVEADNLFRIIHKLTEEGTAIIYISHKMIGEELVDNHFLLRFLVCITLLFEFLKWAK